MNENITLVIPNGDMLPQSMLSNIREGFQSAFEQAETWREKALAIKVTSLADKEAMKQAREMRLVLKNIRVEAEKKRKALKEDALVMGRAIDGVNNLLLAAIQPLERHLEEQERFAERLAEQERQRRLSERTEALQPYLEANQVIPALDAMTDDQFAKYLEDAKLLHAAKLEAAKKAEAERIAREQAEAAERERLRIENERLRAEAAEREAKAKAEREAAELELNRIKAEQEAAAKKEREAREKLERELAAKKAAEEAKAKAEAEAIKKAAQAPDKEKLLLIAESVRSIKMPSVSTDEAKRILADISTKRDNFAKWIENQIATI
jgi:hypothetical protein